MLLIVSRSLGRSPTQPRLFSILRRLGGKHVVSCRRVTSFGGKTLFVSVIQRGDAAGTKKQRLSDLVPAEDFLRGSVVELRRFQVPNPAKVMVTDEGHQPT